MERVRSMRRLVLLCLLISVVSGAVFEDQKNFFYTDPNTGTPPTISYSPPTPSRGGTPPASCGAPPSGGSHTSDPSPPAGHGGGYYHSPPSSTSGPSSTVPPVLSPPSDPNSPPYTCTYWKNHPALIWGLFGWWGSVGKAFGVSNVPGGVGPNMNLLQALSNTRTDGYGEICRQGTAALLNSMVHAKFPYTSAQVRDRFAAAIASDKAAAAQARLFKLANEGKINPRV